MNSMEISVTSVSHLFWVFTIPTSGKPCLIQEKYKFHVLLPSALNLQFE